ncbi:alpha/beta fold hydrolase [Caulobacter segnis]|uniref:alpha/beta fold hydrolase n=1 Tax=Caulobacter segnis TaxID=88688 RepID=UPI00240F81D0|nr:alpha/beta fold hydrolase [Caulobacter segnis]MDG2523612.1 alpha/beta fold hydrolase [Caulobacter segnis]
MDRLKPGAERAVREAGPLDPWLETPGALTAAVRGGSRAFAAGLAKAVEGRSLIRADRMGVAVLDRAGAILFATDTFARLVAPDRIDAEAVAKVLATQRTIIAPNADETAASRSAVAYGPIEQARQWAMPEEAARAARSPRAAIVVVAAGAVTGGEALLDACAAFGLTPLQSRVAMGLVRTGSVRGAAREADVAYETARKVVADAMRRAGATRLSAFIERLVRLSFGVWPVGRDGEAMLADIWRLSQRQAALVLALSQGLSRGEAAKAAGMSDAVAKKQLDVIFTTLGVRTSPELSKLVTEARALAMLTDALQGAVPVDPDIMEPLRLILRTDGTHVAFSDYGPRGGRPVLILHSSSATRAAPGVLVRALQAEGFRPLAIDRPGFGMTDAPSDPAWRTAPFEAACDDVLLVCEQLKLSTLDLIGRGGAQVAVALAKRAPALIDRVLLVNPDPPTSHGRRSGIFGAVKETFFRHPDLIEKFAWTLAAQMTPTRSWRLLARAIENSPPDRAVMSDGRNYADYAATLRPFATGRVAGYVAEQTAMLGWTSGPVNGSGRWRVLQGAHDFIHMPTEVIQYWRGVLPEADFEMIPDAGRYLVLSHPALVAGALKEMTETKAA